MRTMRLAGLLALCGVLAIGTPEAQAKKGGKGNKHYGGVVGLPPGHGGIPPGHGGIPPGQAKKLYTYPNSVSQGYSRESYVGQGGYDYSSYGNGGYGAYQQPYPAGYGPVGPSDYYQPTQPGGGRVDFSGTLIWLSQGYSPTGPYPYPYP